MPLHNQGAFYAISVAASQGGVSMPCPVDMQIKKNIAGAACVHIMKVMGLLGPVVHT